MYNRKCIDTQKIIDTQKNIIVITNGAGLVQSNKAFLDFFDVDSSEFFKSKYGCICNLFEFEENKNYLQKSMNGEVWIDYLLNNSDSLNKVKIADKNNNMNIFEIESEIFYKDNEEILQIVSFHDITKSELRKNELENSLVEKSKELDSINKLFIDSTDVINNYADVSKTDLKGMITYVSKMFCATTGYSKDELIGRCHNIVKSPNKSKEFYRDMWETIEKGDIYKGIIENKTKDGELISFETMIKPDYDENGKKIGYIAFRKNITNEKILQMLVDEQVEQIRKKDKLLHDQSKIASMGKMIENISHQWRQPLSVISTVASGLIVKFEYDMVDKDDAIKNLHILDESSQFLSKTIDDFRDFFKKDKIRKEFNLKETITKSIELVKITLNESSIELFQDLAQEDIIVDGYENELVQALVNILNNSKDILELKEDKGRYVFISLKNIKNNGVITIYDNGGGCEENIISNIFEPYFTTKHQSQGTGIGLYMTSEIIFKHFNGDISVINKEFQYNSKNYTGACFEIKLPL